MTDRAAAVRRVLSGLLVANVAVVVAKSIIGLTAGSLAVLGDALHSGVDAFNNVLGIVVVGVASKAPDEDHPYGHGKFETLGALTIVGFMSITCFELARDAVERLLGARPAPMVSDTQLAILVATLGVNVAVAWYESRRGRELQSEILLADAAHTKSDVFVTVGVLIGLLFARRGWWWVDPVLALLIAGFIVRIAFRIFWRAVPVLVDATAIPTGTIRAVAEGVRGVKGAYAIRSRGGDAASGRYAELTIAVDGAANVAAAHTIADQVEAKLKQDLNLSEVTVHVEPW